MSNLSSDIVVSECTRYSASSGTCQHKVEATVANAHSHGLILRLGQKKKVFSLTAESVTLLLRPVITNHRQDWAIYQKYYITIISEIFMIQLLKL